MNTTILTPPIQQFIASHLKEDLKQLALAGIGLDGVTDIEVLDQIQAKLKSEFKLPIWHQTQNIYFPPKVNLEQTSSSATGEYKSSLIKGKSLIDLTGGFGVDTYYFSKNFEQIIHCEIDEELSKIALHNFTQLQADNITCIADDGLVYLNENKAANYDWIYLDPARRDDQNRKMFQLKDTTPNILYHLVDLFTHTDNIMLKTSPMLDISLGIKHLGCVAEIHVIGINNEVKELLWILKKGWTDDTKVTAINYNKELPISFDFNLKDEDTKSLLLSDPLTYLYEPNACIMKSGGFIALANTYNIAKLHQHSHLYTSDTLKEFPGRRFHIEEIIAYNKKTVRKKFGKQKHNITTRNFTLKVSDIRHLFRIEDGGDSYLFFTTNKAGKKIIIVCSKI